MNRAAFERPFSYPQEFSEMKDLAVNITDVTGQDEQMTLHVHKAQEIPQHWLDDNRRVYEASKHRKAGEYEQAASIPVILVEKWMAEGFDVFKEPWPKIKARLKAEGFDYFITSAKV